MAVESMTDVERARMTLRDHLVILRGRAVRGWQDDPKWDVNELDAALALVPAYEAAVEALELITRYTWGLHLAGTPNEAEAIGLIEEGRAVLARLRETVFGW